jgi:hypothetical protein
LAACAPFIVHVSIDYFPVGFQHLTAILVHSGVGGLRLAVPSRRLAHKLLPVC